MTKRTWGINPAFQVAPPAPRVCFWKGGSCPHEVTHAIQWLVPGRDGRMPPIIYACKAHIPGSFGNPLPKALASVDLEPFVKVRPLGCDEKS